MAKAIMQLNDPKIHVGKGVLGKISAALQRAGFSLEPKPDIYKFGKTTVVYTPQMYIHSIFVPRRRIKPKTYAKLKVKYRGVWTSTPK